MQPFHRPSRWAPFSREGLAGGTIASRGFTLVEMLVATAILVIISLVLVSFSSQVGKVWGHAENQNDYRQHARAVLDYMGHELRCATLAMNRTTSVGLGKPTLQFLIRPSSTPTSNNPDSIFWQAPIATDDKSCGAMAEIGYFVRWDGNQSNLCRFFVNPTDTGNYQIFTASSGQWVTDNLLNSVAGSDSSSNYKALFLENVLGLWVQAYPDPHAASTAAYSNPYDSSIPPNSSHPLPASVVISIVVLDAPRALRLQNDAASVATVKMLVAASADAQTFIASPSLPAVIQNGVSIVSLKVALDNYR